MAKYKGPLTGRGMIRKQMRSNLAATLGTAKKLKAVSREVRIILKDVSDPDLDRIREVFARHGLTASQTVQVLSLLPRTHRMAFYVANLGLTGSPPHP